MYTNLVNAMEFLNENANGFAGILWHQGESDKGTSEQDYYDRLSALIERTRTDSGNENLFWGVAIVSADANGNTYSNVTNAQLRVIADDPLVVEGVNTDEFSRDLRGQNSGNSIHLSEAGLKEAGRLWALTAGKSIIELRNCYWYANATDSTDISNWEINGESKKGVKLVSGANLSVEADNSIQMVDAGTVEVGANYNLTLSGDITGSGEMIKIGKGTLTLSGDNLSAYTGKTTISDGTLKLAADATLNDLSGGSEVKADDPGSVYNPVNLVSEGDLTFNSNSGSDTKFIGKIDAAGKTVTKTGSGTLKIFSDENNVSTASNFIVDVGRLDFKGYFKGGMELNSGAVLSPGNSIGTLTIDGTELPSEVSALTLHSMATLLMEIAGPEPEDNDMLIVLGNLTIEDGAMINLIMADGSVLAPYDTFEAIIQAEGTSKDIIESALTSSFFTGLTVLQDGSTYTITGMVDPNAVPEPSTWMLLILGAAGLLFWRKRK